MRFFGLKSCDSCRKAVRELNESGYNPQIIDVRTHMVGPDDLVQFWDEFGDDLMNRRSTTWRNLSNEDRQRPPLQLLTSHPTLMKRPVVELDGQLFLGLGLKTRTALLG